MYCAAKTLSKVCTSVTTTGTSSAAASCGGYKLVDLMVIQPDTVCTIDQIQLTTANEFNLATASPWNLGMNEGGLIAAAILSAWALGWSFKALRKTIGDNSPE